MEINVRYDNGKVVDNDKKEIGIKYDGNFYVLIKNKSHQLELQKIQGDQNIDRYKIIHIVSRDGWFGRRKFFYENDNKREGISITDDDTGWKYVMGRDRKGPGQYNNENIDLIYLDPKKKAKVAAAITAGTLALLIPLSLHFKGNEIRNKIWNRPTTTQEIHNENSENQIHKEITEKYEGSLSPKSAYLNEDVYEVDINGKNGKKNVIFYITGGKSENRRRIPAIVRLTKYDGEIKKLKVGKEIPGVGYEITGISKEDEKLIGNRELYVNDKGNIGTYYGP